MGRCYLWQPDMLVVAKRVLNWMFVPLITSGPSRLRLCGRYWDYPLETAAACLAPVFGFVRVVDESSRLVLRLEFCGPRGDCFVFRLVGLPSAPLILCQTTDDPFYIASGSAVVRVRQAAPGPAILLYGWRQPFRSGLGPRDFNRTSGASRCELALPPPRWRRRTAGQDVHGIANTRSVNNPGLVTPLSQVKTVCKYEV